MKYKRIGRVHSLKWRLPRRRRRNSTHFSIWCVYRFSSSNGIHVADLEQTIVGAIIYRKRTQQNKNNAKVAFLVAQTNAGWLTVFTVLEPVIMAKREQMSSSHGYRRMQISNRDRNKKWKKTKWCGATSIRSKAIHIHTHTQTRSTHTLTWTWDGLVKGALLLHGRMIGLARAHTHTHEYTAIWFDEWNHMLIRNFEYWMRSKWANEKYWN